MKSRCVVRAFLPGLAGAVGFAIASVQFAVRVASAPFRPISLVARVENRPEESTSTLRPVRVLVYGESGAVRIGAESSVTVLDGQGATLAVVPSQDGPFRLSATSRDGFRLGTRSFPTKELQLLAPAGAVFDVSDDGTEGEPAPRRFPGALRIRSRGDDRFDIVNEVDVESYVASVVASEVWPTFGPEAMRAQAIAARTYVVYQMMRRGQQPFDVAATQSSQVYRGIRTDELGLRAAEAARFTRGVLCTYGEPGEERVFCAYYGAACGGLSQPAAVFGPDGDIPPLAGGVRCEDCKIAPPDVYRWGPVRYAKEELARRLGAKYPEIAAMEGIRRIEVAERTPAGRPVLLRVLGRDAKSFDLLAERFRHAVGPSELRSTDFEIRDLGAEIVFDRGRGFGHGLGLCQWGAEGQSRRGRRAAEILHYYYPQAKLTRGY